MPKVLQNLWEITAAGAALLTNKLVCLQYVKYLLQMFHMLLQSLREHQYVIPSYILAFGLSCTLVCFMQYLSCIGLPVLRLPPWFAS